MKAMPRTPVEVYVSPEGSGKTNCNLAFMVECADCGRSLPMVEAHPLRGGQYLCGPCDRDFTNETQINSKNHELYH